MTKESENLAKKASKNSENLKKIEEFNLKILDLIEKNKKSMNNNKTINYEKIEEMIEIQKEFEENFQKSIFKNLEINEKNERIKKLNEQIEIMKKKEKIEEIQKKDKEEEINTKGKKDDTIGSIINRVIVSRSRKHKSSNEGIELPRYPEADDFF